MPLPPFGNRQSDLFLFEGFFVFFFFCFFCFLDSTYKWNHAIFEFLWLTSLSRLSSRSINVAGNGRISFFMAKWYSVVLYIPHFLYPSIHPSIHPSVLPSSGACLSCPTIALRLLVYAREAYRLMKETCTSHYNLGCFHVLVSVNNASWTVLF